MPNFLSWETWKKDGSKWREHAIDFSRPILLMRPTSVAQLEGNLRWIQTVRAGKGVSMGPSTCSWSMQRTHKKIGTPGWSGDGAGNATDLRPFLEGLGYVSVKNGQVRPGDVVIYLSRKRGDAGHVGIATGSGYGRPVIPQRTSQRGQTMQQPSLQPLRLPRTPLEFMRVDPWRDPAEDAWDHRPVSPDLSREEVGVLASTIGNLPEVQYLLGFLAEG